MLATVLNGHLLDALASKLGENHVKKLIASHVVSLL
jgi:hypothetical protein